MTNYKNMENVY